MLHVYLEENMKNMLQLLAWLLVFFPVLTQSVSQFDTQAKSSPHFTDTQALKFYQQKYAGPTCDDTKTGAASDGGGNKSIHQIFLLPHTHDDVGWQYTVFGYFNNSVSRILDTVTADLGLHPHHRFIWSKRY